MTPLRALMLAALILTATSCVARKPEPPLYETVEFQAFSDVVLPPFASDSSAIINVGGREIVGIATSPPVGVAFSLRAHLGQTSSDTAFVFWGQMPRFVPYVSIKATNLGGMPCTVSAVLRAR